MSGSRERMARSLRKATGGGWTRIVLGRPRDGSERVIERGTETTEAVIAQVTALTRDGFVKVAVVVDATTRVTLDARHGSATVHRQTTAGDASGREDGPSAALLRAIGIANADGTVSAQNARKLKQVRHLVELLRPTWERTAANLARPLRVLDLAAGNSYVGFVLADALRRAGVSFSMHGVEARPDLVARCQERAAMLGLGEMSFATGTIREPATLHEGADLVLALHACDTATDEAIAAGVRLSAAALFCAPCCQAELAAQLRERRSGPSPGIAHHGLLLREYGAVLTDGIRVEVLDACGYEVDVVEFVDPEHTPKNRLIRATRRHDPTPRPGRTLLEVAARCEALGVRPALLALLGASSGGG